MGHARLDDSTRGVLRVDWSGAGLYQATSSTLRCTNPAVAGAGTNGCSANRATESRTGGGANTDRARCGPCCCEELPNVGGLKGACACEGCAGLRGVYHDD